MNSRVPFLVGRDLWSAINGEQDDEIFASNINHESQSSAMTRGNLSLDENLRNGDLRSDTDTSLKDFLLADKNLYVQQSYSDFELFSDLQGFPEVLQREPSGHQLYFYKSGLDLNSNNKCTSTLERTCSEYLMKEAQFKKYKMFLEDSNNMTVNHHLTYLEKPIDKEKGYETISIQESNRNYDFYAGNIMSEAIEQKRASKTEKEAPKLYQEVQAREQKSMPKGSLNSKTCCRFCLKNGEVDIYYQSHMLKDAAGNIVCPILSKYTCPSCGATGKNAHTIRHCPFNENYTDTLRRNCKILRRNAAGHITSFRV